MADHPEYELQDKRVDKQSGRNLKRLDWFIDGGNPDGTVLVVEDVDRFSRLGVTDGVDLLFRLRRKGLAIAVVGDPFNGEVLKDLDDKGEEIIRELKRARRESDRKRDRSEDSVRVNRELIKQRKFTHPKCWFKPREGGKKVHYPLWLDLDPTLNNGDGEFVENAEVSNSVLMHIHWLSGSAIEPLAISGTHLHFSCTVPTTFHAKVCAKHQPFCLDPKISFYEPIVVIPETIHQCHLVTR